MCIHAAMSVLFLVLFGAPFSAGSQGPVVDPVGDGNDVRLGVVGEIAASGSVDEMSDRLRFATVAQAGRLLERLGVEPAIAREAVQGRDDLPAIQLEALPERRSPIVTVHTRYAVLFLPHTVQGMAALYLLSHAKPGSSAWHSTDHLLCASFTHSVAYEIVQLHGQDTPLLALHHVNTSHGSDGSQDETEMYAIQDGKLVERMHTPDSVVKEQWSSRDTSQTLEQQSRFQPFPDGSLEETRSSLLDGEWSGVERRYWHWSAARRQFAPTAFEPVHSR